MKTAGETTWEELSSQAKNERRRGKRLPLVFPIEVSGFTPDGRMFSEKTKTLDISERGCRFILERELEHGEDIAIKLLSRDDPGSPASKPLLFRVAWCMRIGARWRVGVLKLQSKNIWHVAFPPEKLPEKPAE
jgi:hypothetical protein